MTMMGSLLSILPLTLRSKGMRFAPGLGKAEASGDWSLDREPLANPVSHLTASF